MIRIAGEVTLMFALFFALLQSVMPLIGYKNRNPYLLACARPAAYAQAFFVLLAYGLLTVAFVNNDFSIAYVAANSHASLPLMYRLTAVWGAHEGSILLWIVMLNVWTIAYVWVGWPSVWPENFLADSWLGKCLCIFAMARRPPASCALFAKTHKHFPSHESAKKFSGHTEGTTLTISILGIISFCFLCFILFTSDPFLPALHASAGHDLNPLLQDPGFIIHPPMLYLGYVGFSVAFAITQAAFLCNKLDADWAKLARKFALAAWFFLTFGILLGSWWAYRVLGFGGFWFWDPVENASLLPWLSGTALIHVLLLCERRDTAKAWASLLAIITFALSLLGTFLVRSGVLVSVHTFASDPTRGLFLLLLFAVLISAALSVYVARLIKMQKSTYQISWLSRESALLINSALLFIAMLTILLGTLYPLILDALHLGVISVGAPYFNKVMMPLVLITLVLMGVVSLPSIRKLQPGMLFAHAGFAILVIGVLLSSLLNQERFVRMEPGNTTTLGAYQFQFLHTKGVSASNYRGIQAEFAVSKNKRHITNLYPEKRIYTVREMVMTKVDIHPGIFRDLYIALGEPLHDDVWSVRIYYKPFIRWIWFGGLLMMIGAMLSLRSPSLRGRSSDRSNPCHVESQGNTT